LSHENYREYWASWEPGEFDIIPEGVVQKDVFEFDRHDIPDYVPAEFDAARYIWMRYRDGHLMYSGGVMDQPINNMIIISLFNDVFGKWEKYKRKSRNGRR
jgi:hypothetical protein